LKSEDRVQKIYLTVYIYTKFLFLFSSFFFFHFLLPISLFHCVQIPICSTLYCSAFLFLSQFFLSLLFPSLPSFLFLMFLCYPSFYPTTLTSILTTQGVVCYTNFTHYSILPIPQQHLTNSTFPQNNWNMLYFKSH
jgi:hypothetical protein